MSELQCPFCGFWMRDQMQCVEHILARHNGDKVGGSMFTFRTPSYGGQYSPCIECWCGELFGWAGALDDHFWLRNGVEAHFLAYVFEPVGDEDG